MLSEDALARLERNVAREHTARYLERGRRAAGVGRGHRSRLRPPARPARRGRGAREEPRAAREAAGWWSNAGGEAVASAQGVLDDVELALREVADLPSCVKRRDVERVREQVERRQLLMRIRLMTRELEG